MAEFLLGLFINQNLHIMLTLLLMFYTCFMLFSMFTFITLFESQNNSGEYANHSRENWVMLKD